MTALNITPGCFVRLRDGSIHGPMVHFPDKPLWVWGCGEMSWTKEGKRCGGTASALDIIEVLPAPIFPAIAQKARKSARISDGVTIPAGATSVAADGGVLSWDEPARVVTLWGEDFDDYSGSRKWAFDEYRGQEDTHRLDLHIIDGDIVAAIPSRIKEGEE